MKKKVNKNKFIVVLNFIFFRLIRKYLLKKNYIEFFNSIFFHDKNIYQLNNFKKFKSKQLSSIYLLGNFQNENYFKENFKEIRKSIDLNKHIDKKYFKFLQSINFHNAVCVGIRMWEETNSRSKKFGGITDFSFYSSAAKKIKIKNPTYYIFSTLDEKIIKENIDLNGKLVFVPRFNNKYDYINTFRLITKFKYFILSNSTFYWWGAYFAKNAKKVVISNKFKNKKTVPKNWIKL